ncbi:hypothetical protein Leryth_001208 [Lithospermum erythrorhizon]|nr:hypothetical protein Leryth_001208 [Lithospermum erythrorhizon]
MKLDLLIFLIILVSLPTYNSAGKIIQQPLYKTQKKDEKMYSISKNLCKDCPEESVEILYLHNIVRAGKKEQPLQWDYKLERYAKSWCNKRKDCKLIHSFPENQFELGENIYYGYGDEYITPLATMDYWAGEEQWYDYNSNTCQQGQQCDHYTQIVWKDTRRVGCAKAKCDNGDTFWTCNYDPVGNIQGQKPY